MILVTGATGLVGSHLLVQLLQENEEVKALFRSEKQIEKVKNVFAFHNQTALFDKTETLLLLICAKISILKTKLQIPNSKL